MKNLNKPQRPLLKLSTDFVFKRIFAQDSELLADLLNGVLDFPPDEMITELTVLNPEITKDHGNSKTSYLDIRAINKKGVQFLVEMQAFPQRSFIKRAVFYWAQAFARQIESGQGYGFLERCYSVNFLDFDIFPTHANYLSHFLLLNTEDPTIQLTDLVDFSFVELKKFPIQKKPSELKNNLETWIYLFAHCEELTEDDMRTIIDKNPMTQKVYDKLTHMSADRKTREEYDAHIRWQLSQNLELLEAEKRGLEKGIEKGIEKGREVGLVEGIERGREEVALLMLKEGSELQLIAKYTKLPLERVEQLKASLVRSGSQ